MGFDEPVTHQLYRVTGRIEDDSEIDINTIEIRLDNDVLPRELFEISYEKGSRNSVVNFTLRNNKRINIKERWEGQIHNRFLNINELLYGVHNLRVIASDKFNKTGSISDYFSGKPSAPAQVQSVTQQAPVQGFEDAKSQFTPDVVTRPETTMQKYDPEAIYILRDVRALQIHGIIMRKRHQNELYLIPISNLL